MRKKNGIERVQQAEVVKPKMRNSNKKNILNYVEFSNLKTCNSYLGILSHSHGEQSVHEPKVL